MTRCAFWPLDGATVRNLIRGDLNEALSGRGVHRHLGNDSPVERKNKMTLP